MTSEIIINADDFGLNASVNKAIVESFHSGLINSTTMMANMAGFEEAVELAHNNNIVTRIGIHLTLTDGQPLTSDMLTSNLFYTRGESELKKYKSKLFFLTKENKAATYKEFAAQIEKVRKAGIPISHIDTHHHIDDVWSITKIILAVLKSYNIRSMRILNNLNHATKYYKTGYRKIVNGYIKSNRANFSDFLGNRKEAVSFLRESRSLGENKKLEMMVHPDYNGKGKLIDRIYDQEDIFDYPEDIKVILHSGRFKQL